MGGNSQLSHSEFQKKNLTPMAKQEDTLGVTYDIHTCMAASKDSVKEIVKVTKEGKVKKRKYTAMGSLGMRLNIPTITPYKVCLSKTDLLNFSFFSKKISKNDLK